MSQFLRARKGEPSTYFEVVCGTTADDGVPRSITPEPLTGITCVLILVGRGADGESVRHEYPIPVVDAAAGLVGMSLTAVQLDPFAPGSIAMFVQGRKASDPSWPRTYPDDQGLTLLLREAA